MKSVDKSIPSTLKIKIFDSTFVKTARRLEMLAQIKPIFFFFHYFLRYETINMASQGFLCTFAVDVKPQQFG